MPKTKTLLFRGIIMIAQVRPLSDIPNKNGFQFWGHLRNGNWSRCSVKLTEVKVWSYVKSDFIMKRMHIAIDSFGNSCYDKLDGWAENK